MARFIGWIEGQAGAISRLGSPSSGIRAEARGWNVGAKIVGSASGEDDYFDLFATSGSNRSTCDVYLGQIQLVKGVPTFTPRKS